MSIFQHRQHEKPRNSDHRVAVNPTIFAVFAFLALICFYLAGPSPDTQWAKISEHVGIAFLVALILGTTYEYIIQVHRERAFERMLDDQRERLFETLKVHLLLTPEQVFDFIKEVANQTKETPTLYRPARSSNEYTFANSVNYFNTLLGVRRSDVVKALQSWIKPSSHQNLKFLASDFVGMYRLTELAGELRVQAQRALGNTITNDNLGWILNYIWAVSRCESPPYQWLGRVLQNTTDIEIQRWIIFVPRQMPERELGELIRDFIRVRGKSLSDEILIECVHSLAALQRGGLYEGWELLKEFPRLFARPAVLGVIKTCQDLGIPQALTSISIPNSIGSLIQKGVARVSRLGRGTQAWMARAQRTLTMPGEKSPPAASSPIAESLSDQDSSKPIQPDTQSGDIVSAEPGSSSTVDSKGEDQ